MNTKVFDQFPISLLMSSSLIAGLYLLSLGSSLNNTYFSETLFLLLGCSLFCIFSPSSSDNETFSLSRCFGIIVATSVASYAVIHESLMAEVGHSSITIAALSLAFATCYISENFGPSKKLLVRLSALALIISGQASLEFAIDSELLSIEALQALLISSIIVASGVLGHKVYQLRASDKQKDELLETFTLGAPLVLLAGTILYNPSNLLTFNLVCSASFLSVSILGQQKRENTSNVTEDKSSIDFHSDSEYLLSSLSHRVRESLQSLELEVGNLFDSHKDFLEEELESIRGHSQSITTSLEGHICANYILSNELNNQPIDLTNLVSHIKESFRLPSARQLNFHIPDSVTAIKTNELALKFMILDIVNRDQYSKLDFNIHFYNTVNNGETFLNIDVRGSTDDKVNLEKRRDRFKTFDYSSFTLSLKLADKLSGGVEIKSLDTNSPFITLYFKDATISLPERKEDEKVLQNQETHESVLVVDDDPEIADLIADFIESYGIQSFRAQDGQKAIQLYESERPSCVITDILMPEVSGIDVIKSIKGKGSTIIGISGALNPNLEKEVFASGADAFHSKPPNLTTIVYEVQTAIDKKKKP